ncbi:single-stranded-DNA-specific exonuclease RecJ [Fulvimarina sp. 2208YS6-2-32]|uniref:Single-stranded-DNA-specific exonuclease RecJ n=1 Tax=Fulvimarina uroteuthidis TaxID=3098149 RepID=A0ABU5I5S3_9HYPH|nr:single-stranded-DNA-specific exonuclease RecJ [Fulvimarina sp. 2208YS6-2-32]MDY8110561.1 single-stranded-DNA-specific exonuclease RecJ [Fulvimarina sp. 2208YS6-2-32]
MGRDGKTFFGIERSLGGRKWQAALDERGEALALAISQKQGIAEIVARVLAARDVGEDDAATFLAPRLRDLMPDPSVLTDMDSAADRLANAVERRERVAIFGDYDVDGASSSALLWRYLHHFGIDARIYIPDRITEGYGPNVSAMQDLASEASLIVTVDCGTSSFEPIEAAKRAGADVVVLDHHQTGPDIPAASALVNPNRQDDLAGLGYLCAAGVVFMTLVAVNRALRRRGRRQGDLPDILSWLDIVALATVCDVVPLVGLNRAFVVQGVKIMRAQKSAGIAALTRVARLSGPVEPHHLGFLIGPRINAGGRIGDAALGSRLLCLDDAEEADALAVRLDGLNQERQAMEQHMLRDAEETAIREIGEGEGPAVLVTASDEWHPGIVGLLASRLKERFRRPAFAIAFDRNGRGSGSGRSIAGVDLGRIVRDGVGEGLLLKGGGHAMAAGITIERARLGEFRAFLDDKARNAVAATRASDVLRIDGALSASGLTLDLYQSIEAAGPFGQGHATPIFALPNHRIVNASIVGHAHVRATLAGPSGGKVDVIAFKQADTEIGGRLLNRADRPVHVAGSLSLDRFRGQESVRLRVIDLAEAKD